MKTLTMVSLAVLACHASAIADPSPLTLPQAQAEAREHSSDRVAADADLVAAKTRTSTAGRALTHDPIAVGRYQQAAPGGDAGDRTWSLGLEWTFDISGAWNPRRDAARATVAGATHARTAALLDLDVAVAFAFAELADVQRRIARFTKLVELRQLAARIATRVRETGGGTQLEVDAATLDLHSAQIVAANARGDLETARIRLARLLGRRDPSGLTVADDIDMTPAPNIAATDELVDRDPRARSALAELAAARSLVEAASRGARPSITVGLEVGRVVNDIPVNTFAASPMLAGSWREWELALQISVPLPLIERNRTARASARADAVVAEARVAHIRAEVRSGYAEARARLVATVEAATAAAEIPPIIEREIQLLDKALRAGGIELDAWAQQARRLVEVGRTYDEAILALRRARASWVRLLQR